MNSTTTETIKRFEKKFLRQGKLQDAVDLIPALESWWLAEIEAARKEGFYQGIKDYHDSVILQDSVDIKDFLKGFKPTEEDCPCHCHFALCRGAEYGWDICFVKECQHCRK